MLKNFSIAMVVVFLSSCGAVNVTDLDPKAFSSIPTGASTSCDGVDNGFVPNVIPIFKSEGCAAGSCHAGSNPGGNFNVDTSLDAQTIFVNATSNGRANKLFPQNSSLLRKPLGLDGHSGSKLFTGITDPSYVTIYCWIAAGAQNTTETTALPTPTPTPTVTPTP